MRLVGLLIVLLPPAARAATAPGAATTAMAAANPLLSLNIPNPLNALGLGLGNFGAVAGMPFGNMFGFGHMLGHFYNYNNMFFNQLLFSGLFGLVILKILGVVVVLTALIAGVFLVKLVGLALVLTVVKSSHHHDHYSHHPYRRAFYTTIVHNRSPWSSKKKPADDVILWDD
ncbi:Hypothetical protein NTJ_07651 [Nesidiocoris tenuis]|uniref:Uncharacterized protein n=1 Tax=Nesidiocoris tenuis TaxID=355587 RepID=A0ABN7ARK7_9HEMI|nr:Hypothetical protein NTJ_07651 [Nesidiocoris tenuis]